MDYFKIVLTSLLSVCILFFITKLIGNKQLAQLSLFDYINGITIGSIAAELATEIEGDLYQPLIAMIVYGIASISINMISDKYLRARRFLEGKSLILLDHGKLCCENFKKANLDLNEFLTQCRINGYFSLSELHTVILEANGGFSFLPKEINRPAAVKDLGQTPQQTLPEIAIIQNGKILKQNLKAAGKDEIWVKRQLEEQHVKLHNICYAGCDGGSQLHITVASDRSTKNDIFE